MRNKDIMFIIFPGNMTTRKHFQVNYIGNKSLNNSNFIPELKKLGKVYFVEPNWNNLSYYDKNNIWKHFYHKNIDFTLDDLNIEKYCTKVYTDIKDFKGKFVLIGHSIGLYWVYYFSQKYSSRCLFNFILDGSLISPKILKERKSKIDKYYKKENITINAVLKIKNDEILELIRKSKLYDINAVEKLQGICKLYIIGKMKINVKTLKVKIILFRNLNFEKNDNLKKNIDNEEYLFKHNPAKYRTIYFVNKSHFPHWCHDSREIILNTIKSYIL